MFNGNPEIHRDQHSKGSYMRILDRAVKVKKVFWGAVFTCIVWLPLAEAGITQAYAGLSGTSYEDPISPHYVFKEFPVVSYLDTTGNPILLFELNGTTWRIRDMVSYKDPLAGTEGIGYELTIVPTGPSLDPGVGLIIYGAEELTPTEIEELFRSDELP